MDYSTLQDRENVKESDIINDDGYLNREMSLIFVDCEGHGPAPGLNNESQFEFGAVEFKTRKAFHGQFGEPKEWRQVINDPNIKLIIGDPVNVLTEFKMWLEQFDNRPVFVSDNPAYDWQFINYYFHKYLGHNPFGWSARRISDYYAGLTGDWKNTQRWKRLRITKHTHDPIFDAKGNLEAFERLQNGER